MRMGTFGVSVGVSSIAEIQVDGGVRNKLTIAVRVTGTALRRIEASTGDTTIDVEDLVVGTKVRLVGEGQNRPSIALRFATRLPNASNESGLGLDTIDFHFGMAIAKTVRSVRLVGNFGFGILPDPQRGDRQNDVVAFGGSVARAVGSGVELVGELNGRMSLRNGDIPDRHGEPRDDAARRAVHARPGPHRWRLHGRDQRLRSELGHHHRRDVGVPRLHAALRHGPQWPDTTPVR